MERDIFDDEPIENESAKAKFGVAGFKAGECECGQIWMLLNDAKLAETMRQTFAETMRQRFAAYEAEPGEHTDEEKPGNPPDVFVCADGVATCSECGKVVELPASEVLDLDRSLYGQWRLGLEQDDTDTEKLDSLIE